MLLSDYIETLTEGQRLIIKDVAAEARRSNSTKSMLAGVRRVVAKCFLKLWGEDIFPAKVKLGYEPDWVTLDIDWDLPMEMALKKEKWGLTRFIAKVLGLETKLLNFCYGTRLPKDLAKAGRDEAGLAIIVAAILDAQSL